MRHATDLGTNGAPTSGPSARSFATAGQHLRLTPIREDQMRPGGCSEQRRASPSSCATVRRLSSTWDRRARSTLRRQRPGVAGAWVRAVKTVRVAGLHRAGACPRWASGILASCPRRLLGMRSTRLARPTPLARCLGRPQGDGQTRSSSSTVGASPASDSPWPAIHSRSGNGADWRVGTEARAPAC
jgi:hypothetical protein